MRRRLLKAEHVAELHKALAAMGNGEMCELSLSYNRLHNDGLTHLAHLAAAGGGAGVLAKLQRLFVDSNRVGDAGIVALASAASKGALPKLQQLSLKFNEVGPVGINALAEAIYQGGLPELQAIHLDQNRLSGAAHDTPDTDDSAVQQALAQRKYTLRYALHLHRICTASATHMHCICTASALQALAARKRGQKPSSVTGPPRRGMRSAPAPRSSLPLMKGAMRRDSLLAAARIEAEQEARARHRDSKRLANQAWAAPHSAWLGAWHGAYYRPSHRASHRPSYHPLHAASLAVHHIVHHIMHDVVHCIMHYMLDSPTRRGRRVILTSASSTSTTRSPSVLSATRSTATAAACTRARIARPQRWPTRGARWRSSRVAVSTSIARAGRCTSRTC